MVIQTLRHSRRFRFAPERQEGMLAVSAFVDHISFMILVWIVVTSGQRGGDEFFGTLWRAIPMLLAGVAGAATGVLALYALLRRWDWAAATALTAFVGLLVILFIAGDVLSPH
jgi:hypothetical protein